MAANTMNATPFFGSKISLISKSEIRYEGILYTVDPKESTIALAQVRSFGSEDRIPDKPVPPRDEVFQYIIFRASDIKDLIVDQPPSPALADPAIIQAHHSNGSNSFPSSFPQPSSTNAGQSSSTIQQQLQQAGLQNTVSVSTSIASKPNTNQQAASSSTVQNLPNSSKAKTSTSSAQVVASNSTAGAQTASKTPNKQQQLPQRTNANQMSRSHVQQNNRNQDGGTFMGNRPNFNKRLNNNIRSPMNGFNQRNGGQNFNRNFINRFQPRQQSAFSSYNRRQTNRNFVSRQTPKPSISLPETDFDFEKAQDEFKQLEEKLANLKVNGDAPESAKEPAVNNTDVTTEVTKDPCYNKEKSFFDKISCESLERERGNVQRVDWKAERKLNRETFGVVPMRRTNGFRPMNRFSGGGHGFRGYQSYHHRNRNQGSGGGSGTNAKVSSVSTVSSTSGPSLTTATNSSLNVVASPAN